MGSMDRNELKNRTDKYRDAISRLFIDISKIIFTGVVIGGISPVFMGSETSINFMIVISGAVVSFIAAWIGCRILKP